MAGSGLRFIGYIYKGDFDRLKLPEGKFCVRLAVLPLVHGRSSPYDISVWAFPACIRNDFDPGSTGGAQATPVGYTGVRQLCIVANSPRIWARYVSTRDYRPQAVAPDYDSRACQGLLPALRGPDALGELI